MAEYVDTEHPLADIGEPRLELTTTTGGGVPGFRLGRWTSTATALIDGILVGEPAFYGNNWWLNNGCGRGEREGRRPARHPAVDLAASGRHAGRVAGDFPDAVVMAFGFSLGSGVQGDLLLERDQVQRRPVHVPRPITLTSKDQCKNGGWGGQTSDPPTYKNQGNRSSSFAKSKN